MAATGLLGINPYRQGQGIDISSKPTAIYVDMQQKERARQDALDRYFMEFDKNINPAGMRTFDIDDLTKMQMDAKQYFFKNKDNIKNPMKDGGKAYTEWMGMNKKQLALVTASKAEAESAKQYQKLYQAATSKGQTVDEGTLAAFAQSQKRIVDPAFSSFNLSQFDTYTPFNALKTKEKFFGKDGKNFTQEKLEYGKSPDGKYNTVTTTTVLNPTPSNLATIKTMAGAELDADLSRGKPGGFARYINAIQKDPEAKAQLNELHKQYYGADIQDEKDIAAAVVVGLWSPESTAKTAPEDQASRDARRNYYFNVRKQSGEFDADFEIDKDYAGLKELTEAQGFSLKALALRDSRVKEMLQQPGIKNAMGVLPTGLTSNYTSKEGGIRNPTFMLMDEQKNVYIVKDAGGEIKLIVKPANVYRNDYIKERAGTAAVKNSQRKSSEAPKTPAPKKNVVQGKPDKGL